MGTVILKGALRFYRLLDVGSNCMGISIEQNKH